MLKPFNIVFYNGDSVVGKLIKLVSSADSYSHCALLLDEWHCVESAWNNPCVVEHFSYKNKTYDIYELTFELSDDQKCEIAKYIREQLHSGYDYVYLITRGLNYFFNSPIYNSKKTVTCDELIVSAFERIGIKLIEGKLSPDSLSKSKLLRKIN